MDVSLHERETRGRSPPGLRAKQDLENEIVSRNSGAVFGPWAGKLSIYVSPAPLPPLVLDDV